MLRRPLASTSSPFVDVKVQTQPVLLRQVEHAPQLVHDALVAIDESTERAACALHLARDALARREVGKQVERRERNELQLDAAAPRFAQRLEHGQRGRRLGLHPVDVRAPAPQPLQALRGAARLRAARRPVFATDPALPAAGRDTSSITSNR
jgi:hypothetical protein